MNDLSNAVVNEILKQQFKIEEEQETKLEWKEILLLAYEMGIEKGKLQENPFAFVNIEQVIERAELARKVV